jgi:hypothetical protein
MSLRNLNTFMKPPDLRINKEAIDILIAEGGESFYNYVDRLGLAEEPNLVVISSKHHYYYDKEEMKCFNTLINLKELNQIKNIKTFLNSFMDYLPLNSNFVGCFTDNEKVNGYELKYRSSGERKKGTDDIKNGIVSSFSFVNMLYSVMDFRVYNYISKTFISQLFGEYGYKIIDMSEVHGLTFFHSKKSKALYN